MAQHLGRRESTPLARSIGRQALDPADELGQDQFIGNRLHGSHLPRLFAIRC